MPKRAELLLCVLCIILTAVLGAIVITNNPDLRLEDIALLKLFYLSMLNVAIFSFLAALRGVKEDALDIVWANPVARAIVICGYILAAGTVIGR